MYQILYNRFFVFFAVLISLSIYFYFKVPVIDDALIIQRYIDNFLNGSGLYFNHDEPYYGYTAIFPTWINAAIAFFSGLDMHILRFVLPSACLIVMMEILYQFVFERKLIATLLGTLNPIFIYYLYSGLESYFIIFFILIFVRQVTSRHWGSLVFITPLAPFFRPELILISIPVFVFSLLKIGKNKITIFALALIIPLLTLSIIVLNYDNLVPLSITAKIIKSMDLVTFLRAAIIQTLGFYYDNFLQFTAYIITIAVALYAILLAWKNQNKFLLGIIIGTAFYSIYLLLSKAYYPWYFSSVSLLISVLWLFATINVNIKMSVFLHVAYLLFLGSQINYVLDRNNFVQNFYVELLGSVSEKVKTYNRAGSTVIVGSSGYVGVELSDYIVRDTIGLDTPKIIDILQENNSEIEVFCLVDWDIFIMRQDPAEISCLEFKNIDTVENNTYGTFYIVQR